MALPREPTVKLVARALEGDLVAERELLEIILPAIRIAVADALRRRISGPRWSRVRHDVDDLTQDVLFALLKNDGKRLRSWDPERGLSLRGYVKLISKMLVESFLRKRKNTEPWKSGSIEDSAAEAIPHPGKGPLHEVEQRALLSLVIGAMEAELRGDTLALFRMLFMEDLEVNEISARTGMSANAVHVARHRFRVRLNELRRMVFGDLAD